MTSPATLADEPRGRSFRDSEVDPVAAGHVATFIDRLLSEQRALSAVEVFAQQHARETAGTTARYSDLIPLTAPRPGEQYAFEVDLDRCSGCKACVAACHSLNGLDDGESWRDVGVLVGELPEAAVGCARMEPIQLTVTTACHHCVEPGCLLGCPVLAYEKDPTTGIVRHLDDQCIGCSYCLMKCPYDVPKYSARRGIVRKCDLCHGRLAEGEAPACAQACPTEAIRITLADVVAIRAEARRPAHERDRSSWFPGAPDSRTTLPTTAYISRRRIPELSVADRGVAGLEPAHWPLILMLVFTQAAAGLFVAASCVTLAGFGSGAAHVQPAGLVGLIAGLAAAGLHLGQPLKAWRAFLGWRTSWLSREILAFGLFAGAASTSVASSFLPALDGLRPWIGALPTGAGLLAVFTSAMVYIDTKRPFWGAWPTFGQFGGTTLLLGATLAAALLAWLDRTDAADLSPAVGTAAIVALAVRTWLFGWRCDSMRKALDAPGHPLHRNARVIRERLQGLGRARVALFVVSTGAGLIALVGPPGTTAGWATAAAIATLASELAGRYVYFVAVAPRRMPGGVVG